MKPIAVVLLIVGALGLATCGSYNQLVADNQNVYKRLGNLDAAYQRRFDLIPNLVETVRTSGQFEERIIKEVVDARATIGSLQLTPSAKRSQEEQWQFLIAQEGLKLSLNRLIAMVERYPTLKSTRAYQDLMVQLEGTENRIQKARIDFNTAVIDYNTTVESFPTSIVARQFNFTAMQYFHADSGADRARLVNVRN